MKINAVSYAAHSCTMRGSMPVGKMPDKNDNKIGVSDILPAAGILGAGLMSVYFIRKSRPNDILKTADKLLKSCDNKTVYEKPVKTTLKNGYQKVEYMSHPEPFSDISHSIVFNRKGKPVKQVHSVLSLESIGTIPVGYNRQTQIISGKNNHISFVETEFSLDMKPKHTTFIRYGQKEEITYGYDFNRKLVGSVSSEGDKAYLKYIGSKETKEYNSVEEALKNQEWDDFKKL